MEMNWLLEKVRYEIKTYESSKGSKDLIRTHVSFYGSPLRHPYDPEKIFLVSDPFSPHPFYYEFRSQDISYVERLPSLVNLDGETVIMARIWVKKKSVGVRCSPFLV